MHHLACQITRPNTTDFFLWGFVKDVVYRAPVRDWADLQERIYAAVNNVTPSGSNGSMSASGSAGPGFDPRRGSKF